jgi:hypothetical protein
MMVTRMPRVMMMLKNPTILWTGFEAQHFFEDDFRLMSGNVSVKATGSEGSSGTTKNLAIFFFIFASFALSGNVVSAFWTCWRMMF